MISLSSLFPYFLSYAKEHELESVLEVFESDLAYNLGYDVAQDVLWLDGFFQGLSACGVVSDDDYLNIYNELDNAIYLVRCPKSG